MRVCGTVAFLLVVIAALAASHETSSAQPASRRMAPAQAQEVSDSLRATLRGTIVKIEDMTDRDGPLWIFLDTGRSEPVKIVFGSLYTRPRPSDERQDLYRRLMKLKVGDRVRADGYTLEQGFMLADMTRVDAGGKVPTLKLDIEEDWLLLIKQVPLGISYDELNRRLPGLSEFIQEGAVGDARGAKKIIPLYGYGAELVFVCRHDALESYHFHVGELSDGSAQELYAWMRKFYTEHFGEYSEETIEADGQSLPRGRWRGDGFAVVLSRIKTSYGHKVSWGFEK